MDFALVALGFGVALVSYAIKAARYLLVLGPGAGFRRLFGIAIAQNVIDQLAPMRAGDVGWVVLARQTGVASAGYALASLLLIRAVDLTLLWAMYVATLAALSLDHPAYRWAAVGMGALVTAGVAVFAAMLFAAQSVGPCLRVALERLGLLRSAFAQRAWEELVVGAANLAQVVRPGRVAAILVFSVATWAVTTLLNWLMWLAVGVRLTGAQAVFMTSFSYLIALLPVFLFSGIGVSDLLFAGVLTAFGKPMDAAAAFSLCSRVLTTLYQALLTLVFFVVMWGQWRPSGTAQSETEAGK
jgi:uncharacterized protein (TIRG00374 family)